MSLKDVDAALPVSSSEMSSAMQLVNVLVRILQGTMSARFLRHEGFLGAVGAFLKVHPMTPPNQPATVGREPRKVSALNLIPCLASFCPLPSSTIRQQHLLCISGGLI